MDDLLKRLNGGVLVFQGGKGRRLPASALRILPVSAKPIVGADTDFVILTTTTEAHFEILPQQEARWHFPVGSERYPIEKWYIASRHLERGTIWKGGIHTGIDYNVEVAPRGDIDRGQPTWAVSDGVIHGTWYSNACLGSVVYRVEHNGTPLWVRHWHLAKDEAFLSWQAGMSVEAGQLIGHLGNYAGGDHLHFDMCLEAFHPGVWWMVTSGATNEEKLARWVDPVKILKSRLDPVVVDASLRIG